VQRIPLLDISGCAGEAGVLPERLVSQFDRAFRETGFLYLAGHGISGQTISAVRREVAAWFAKPLQEKLASRISRENYRGYIPLGFFSANSGELAADHYEGFKLHRETDPAAPVCAACDLYGPNRWPPDAPGLRAAVLEYWRECDRVASILLATLARLLDVDPRVFLQLFDDPLTNMTLLHYPPRDPRGPRYGIHPHKDTDVITLLAPDPVGGLKIRPVGETAWIDADPPEGVLVVNTGDLLELWSGGRYVSTPHKVETAGDRARFSFPYFVVPRHDTVVQPLVPPKPGFERAPVPVGDVSREVWRTNWPDARPGESGYDLGTLSE
jgi:isopenicillin N synthase-like dioxygenase